MLSYALLYLAVINLMAFAVFAGSQGALPPLPPNVRGALTPR